MSIDLGSFGMTADGRCALTFERKLAHSPAKVWRAVTEPAQLRSWFVQIVDYDQLVIELRPGAALTFFLKPGYGDPLRGEVVRVEPPRLLEFTWADETLRFEIEPRESGCVLTFTNIFDDQSAANALGAGWHAGLDLLSAYLDGESRSGLSVAELQAEYEKAFGVDSGQSR
jgi:uncharacterized protein YndB with AHSA1/START domain